MLFLDEAKIYLKAGDGGNGCMSFRREKNLPFGGPDGGNGGKGGNIVIKVNKNLTTLIDYRYKQHFMAKRGEHGMGSNCNGKFADDIVLEVPAGTQIFEEDGETLIIDAVQHGKEYIIAEGGKGGLGNAFFKTSTNRAPRRTTQGALGIERWIWLKLKLISDVGLVGFPNAGKSTFLSAVTAAKPKIADYPFTTLKPKLGVVKVGDFSFVLADLPGLIEGASQGVGLGDRFLKHVERCKTLIHLIDISSDDIINDYEIISHELEEYNDLLKDKKRLVALNKIDLISKEEAEEKKNLLEKHINAPVYLISTATNKNLELLLKYTKQLLELDLNTEEQL